MRECFLNVVDISEYDALDVLTTVMKLARTPKHTRTSDSMAVDDGQDENIVSHSNIPPLRTLFAYVVNYAGSLQAWRLAIYKHFPQAEDILELLGIIEEWMKVYGSKDLQLSLGETKLNEQGVPVPKFDYSKKLERVKGMLLPPLDKVCSAAQVPESHIHIIHTDSLVPSSIVRCIIPENSAGTTGG